MASIEVDMELKKAFQELQSKLITSKQQMKMSDLQIEQLKRANHHASLVEVEIKDLPETTKTYEGVGRMFLLQPVPVIKTNLEAKVKANEEKIKSIQTTKEYLERNMKESENNLRELVLSKRQERP